MPGGARAAREVHRDQAPIARAEAAGVCVCVCVCVVPGYAHARCFVCYAWYVGVCSCERVSLHLFIVRYANTYVVRVCDGKTHMLDLCADVTCGACAARAGRQTSQTRRRTEQEK